MARRRLLTLLASTAVLTAALAGPAAAEDLVGVAAEGVTTTAEAAAETTRDTVVGATVERVEVETEAATEPVADAVAETVVTEEPAPAPRAARPAAPASEPEAEPAAAPVEREGVVAAGNVTSAPPLEFLASIPGSEPTAGRAPAAPMAPAVAADPTDDEVAAPLIAPPAPATTTAQAPSVLAQSLQDLPEEGTTGIAMVALAALLAAGAGTVQGARTQQAG